MNIIRRLKTSIYRSWYKRLSRTNWKVVRFLDAEFVMTPSNYIDRRMCVEGGYEKAQLSYLLQRLEEQPFDAFIDIGANFGLYSCITGCSGRVPVIYSFECDPRNILHFQGHIRMNGLSEIVSLHTIAVGDRNTEITFSMTGDGATGHSHVHENIEGYEKIHSEQHTTIQVPQKPIDEVLLLEGKTLAIKIDVEGYEQIALKGMGELLRNNKCLIQIEAFDTDKSIENYLGPRGYTCVHRIDDDWYFSNMD
jgi:FkbM family methyltransferase